MDKVYIYICPKCGEVDYVEACSPWVAKYYLNNDGEYEFGKLIDAECEQLCPHDIIDMAEIAIPRDMLKDVIEMDGKDRVRWVIDNARKGVVEIINMDIDEFERYGRYGEDI